MKSTRLSILSATVALVVTLTACQSTTMQNAASSVGSAIKTAASNVAAFLAKPTTQAAVKTIIADAAPLVKQYAETGHVSNAQGIALGLQSITAAAPAVTSNAELQKLIINTVTTFAADPGAKKLGQDLAQVAISQLSPTSTPQDVTNAIVGLGIGASNGANDPAVVK